MALNTKNDQLFNAFIISGIVILDALIGLQFKSLPLFFILTLLHLLVFYGNLFYFSPNFLFKKETTTYFSLALILLIVISSIISALLHLFGVASWLNCFTLVFTSTLAAILGSSLWALGKEFYQKEKLRHRIKVQHQESELQFLRAQLNPHFLFNSLNSIYSLVLKKSAEAPNAVITLSELMRYMVYEADREKVPLSKEIEYIKNYVQLQTIRLSNSEHVKVNIRGGYENKKITPLLLMPFIENAFKYGTDYQGVTDISILLEVIENELYFTVKNKIRANKKVDESFGIGLQNVKSTLDLVYPNTHVLTIEEEDGYYNVNLKLNLG